MIFPSECALAIGPSSNRNHMLGGAVFKLFILKNKNHISKFQKILKKP
jgi:hypothetical protein